MFLRAKCNSSVGWDSTNLHAYLCGIPPLNPTKGFRDPGFPTALPQPALRVRLSLKESRMKFVDPTSLTGNPGDGAPACSRSYRPCPTQARPKRR
jgi:hypothetical protein